MHKSLEKHNLIQLIAEIVVYLWKNLKSLHKENT